MTNPHKSQIPPPPTKEEVAELQRKANEADSAGRQAAGAPLPASTRIAFATVQSIGVNDFSVRPMVNRDFVFFTELEHPFKDVTKGTLDENAFNEVTNSASFVLCWVLTRPAKEVRQALSEKGVGWVRREAEEVFGEVPMGVLVLLLRACFQQMAAFWSTALEVGSVGAEGEKGSNPCPPTLTVLAG